jgi:hypothetical protein
MYTLPLSVLAVILVGFLGASLRSARSTWNAFVSDTAKQKVFAIANVIMLVLLLLSVAVQYNDPDWLLWMIIYSYASVVTWLAVGKKYSFLAPVGAIGYVLYALYWMPNEMVEHPSNLLLDMRMHEKGVEEVREDMGLWICAAWMLVIAVAWWVARKRNAVAVEQARNASSDAKQTQA